MHYQDGGGRRYQMTGHHYPGQPWERYTPDDCFELDEAMYGLGATDHESLERQRQNQQYGEILERVLEQTAD